MMERQRPLRSRGSAHALGVVLASVLSLSAASARAAEPPTAAQSPSPAQINYARALFAEGQALMTRDEWSAAAEKFVEALRVKRTPGLHYHLALCEENSGRLLEAQREYRQAQELLATLPATDVEALLGPALERIDSLIPRLRLVLPDDVRGARVELDGTPVDMTSGEALPVAPGSHAVRVEALGYDPFTVDVEARPKETNTVVVRLVSKAPPPPLVPSAATADETSPSPWRTGTLIGSATIAAAGLGVGVWGLIERGNRAADVGRNEASVRERAGALEGACASPSVALAPSCASLQKSLEAQDRATALAVGGFVTLAAGLTATVATLLFWPERPLAVKASVAVDGGGLTVSGAL